MPTIADQNNGPKDVESSVPELSYEVPPFPETATQLVSAINQPDVEVSSVVQLIECEPSVFAKVLRMANSPLYGTSRTITTVGHAVVVLGLKAVSQLALAVATESVFNDKSECGDTRARIYCQSLAIAAVAREISYRCGTANPDEAFLCGVVHDIGKIILLNSVGEDYRDLLVGESSGNIAPIETDLYGVCHPRLGEVCGRKWGLPTQINLAIGNHHQPIDSVADPLSETIILANSLARTWELGFSPDEASAAIASHDGKASEIAGSEVIQEACEQHYEAIRDICAS